MKKKSALVVMAVLMLLGITGGAVAEWLECVHFGCGYAGAACQDGGKKMWGCAWILCDNGGSIMCPEPPPLN